MAKSIRPIYVLYGDDAFLRDEARKEIVSAVVGDADPQLCVTTFDPDAALVDVLDELRTIPLLAPRRAVIVRDAGAFVSAHRDALETYLQDPPPHASLILIVSSWPSNTRLYRRVAEIGETRDCTAPDTTRAGRDIRSALQRRGKKIDPDAADLLLDLVGVDLAALNCEVEKLVAFAGSRDTITAEDVARLVSRTAAAEPFALTNAITAANPTAALGILSTELVARGDEFRLLGQIAWHLRRALAAAQDLAAGRTPSLRMPYPLQRPFLDMVRRRGPRRLQADFRRLIAADLALKSGATAQAAMQQLVVSLCT